MEFNILALIAHKLNNRKYKEAIGLIKQQKGNILPSEACFLANGMDIRQLKEIVDIFPNVDSVDDFRGKLRIEMAKELKKKKIMEQRTIKFKAKCLDNREWVEGYYIKKPSYHQTLKGDVVEDGEEHLIFGMTKDDVQPLCYEVDPSTVCQFTGLKDKDGKEIWEHDYIYVVLPYILSGEVIYDNELCRYIIEPDKESSSNYTRCFSFSEIEGMSSFDEDTEIYVIGNKFDRKDGK